MLVPFDFSMQEPRQMVYEKVNGHFVITIVDEADNSTINLSQESFFELFPEIHRNVQLGCGSIPDEIFDELFPPDITVLTLAVS